MPMIFDETESALEPIAIVGMVDSSAKFWDVLRKKKSVRTPRVPTSRFNIDAHYHPDLSRPGSFSAMGGYFLDENPIEFDPSFFNMTPIEAQWLDPQQRKILEVCYEVLENAGIPLEKAAGSNTGVYLATFTSDYQQMSIFERDFRHNYAATGVDPGIISNRVNNTFNLAGPSCIINTACSSSVYAIHNACHALRAHDCNAAIAAGSNIVMIVVYYSGVIRSSAVNTNGKVEGMGITYPNALGQEKVLRHAYKRANLAPNRTAYLECHGTGTPTGDPIEVRAVSLGMNDTRSRSKPLLLGAAKANIGHSEAASGIFAAMKAALMTEKGEIPGVCGFKTLNPNIKDKEWNVKIVEDLMPWPAEFDVRRASVSSFGYGGTNAHLVIESVHSICPWYEHGQPKATSSYSYHGVSRPFLVTMSAHNEKTLKRNIKAHQEVADDYHLIDLAYTLNQRRSHLASRAYTIAEPGLENEAFNTQSFSYGSRLSRTATVGFVFTGQGAQWARMGYEAMQKYPAFRETIDALDRVLQQIEPRPTWSLSAIIEDSEEVSRIGEAEISQPICTAVQIAIVDLFASWGIEPSVTAGHSSGEIAAAYASGRITAPDAMLAAYFRGYAVAKAAPVGTMLAVGVGEKQVLEYMNLLDPQLVDRLTIACDNSPDSVTMSGSEQDIVILKEMLDHFKVFSRQLKTGKAYHSPQMDVVAPLYTDLYSKAQDQLRETDQSWRRPLVGMVSSVTATEVESSELSISYWCDNLRNRVLFNQALTALGSAPQYASVNILVEIGPHAALGGPIKQIVKSNDFDMQYICSLKRGTDSASALLKTVGELYVRGLEIDFDLVNAFDHPVSPVVSKGRIGPRYLPDLPHYQWNYEKVHWYQPRVMQELRESKYPRHDLLGRRIFGLSANSSTWRNILRQRDVAWFADHTLGSEVVFAAAGHVSLAIEALLQQLDLEPKDAAAVRFQDISIEKALVVPETDEGIEVHTRLERHQAGGAAGWYTFTVETVEGDSWTQHSTGKIQMRSKDVPNPKAECPYQASQLHQQVSGKRWYRSFHRVGFRYGSNFQTVTSVRANGKDRVASAGVKVQTSCSAMKDESRYLIHPSTIDGCLHVIIAAVHRGLHKEMPWGVIPVEIREMTLQFPSEGDLSTEGICTAWADHAQGRNFEGRLQLFGSSGQCLIDIHDWRFVTYDAAVPPQLSEPTPRQPYRQCAWHVFPTTSETTESMQIGKTVVLNLSGASTLAEHLGVPTVLLHDLETQFPAHATGLIIDDAEGAVLTSALTEQTWNHLRNVLHSDIPVAWVTRGANSGRSAASGIPQGFLRTVRSERPSARIILIDADDTAPLTFVTSVVMHRLAALSSPERSTTDDVEFWISDDYKVWTSRLQQNKSINEVFYPNIEAQDAVLSEGTPCIGVVEDNEVVFEAIPAHSAAELAPFEIEIQVSFAEISKDILAARSAGQATIVTGIVQRVGSGLEPGLVGEPVAAYTQKTLTTRLCVSVFTKLSGPGLLESAVGHLPHVVKAFDAIITASGAQAADHVVLLPTGSPLFDSVVSKLSARVGFHVTTITEETFEIGSSLKHERGRVIVVAAEPSPQIPEFWRAMPRGSTFVLSGVAIEDYSLDMRLFSRGVELQVRNVHEALQINAPELMKTLQASVEILKEMGMPILPSLPAGSLMDLSVARRTLTDSSILSFNYGEDNVKSRTSRQPTQFSSHGFYLLVGCLGGIGRSLTTWMFDRGCRNFAFISRSGITKPEAADVVRTLEKSGAKADVFCADASDEKAVADIVSALSTRGPIKGVVHAAMVLQDGLYENMSFPAFQAAMRPKVQAAIALDSALKDTPLDFFIMTSSISGVLGNQGQANYAAANSYLDFLALQRRRRGLAACSLALPLVEDVGVVAENAHIADALARKMPFGVSEREMLEGFEAAVIQGRTGSSTVHLGDVQLILGLEPKAMLQSLDGLTVSDSFWYNDARMSDVREELETLLASAGNSADGGAAESFIATLTGLSETESLAAIGSHVMHRAARILGANEEDFKYDGVSIANHGIDSMIGVELQSWLFKEFNLNIGVQTLSHPNTTFAGLAATIAGGIGLISG
nr:highly reducing polyketide synthase curs1 [Quercus suber]